MLAREQYIQRPEYRPTTPQDQFIVPLLQEHIEQILLTYTKTSLLHPRVLDVGCGRQPFRTNLEALGYTYISIDALQNLEESVDIVCEIDKQLPPEILSHETFNFILCTEVMEHVANWDVAFSNFSHLLAPGGRLFITCPYFYPLHEEPYDFWRATPYALQYFGDRFGLKLLYQVNAGNAWDVLGTLLGHFYSQPASRSLRDRLLNRTVSLCRRFLFWLVASRQIQKAVHLHSSLYLANIVVFEK